MTTYNVVARPWERGWELHVHGVGVTQVRNLDHAEQQARDLIHTMTGRSANKHHIEVVIDIGEMSEEISQARRMTIEAAELQQKAAEMNRAVVARLRRAQFSVSDIATVLGVSRGRVSQLLADQ